MLGTQPQTDPHALIDSYLHRNARVTEALKLLKITPEEYARLLASRSSHVGR